MNVCASKLKLMNDQVDAPFLLLRLRRLKRRLVELRRRNCSFSPFPPSWPPRTAQRDSVCHRTPTSLNSNASTPSTWTRPRRSRRDVVCLYRLRCRTQTSPSWSTRAPDSGYLLLLRYEARSASWITFDLMFCFLKSCFCSHLFQHHSWFFASMWRTGKFSFRHGKHIRAISSTLVVSVFSFVIQLQMNSTTQKSQIVRIQLIDFAYLYHYDIVGIFVFEHDFLFSILSSASLW